MVLSEGDPHSQQGTASKPEPATERSDWLGLTVWLAGFLFLAILALWDMVASLFR